VISATDGEENDSREWSLKQVGDLIAQQEKDYDWKFLFIGAGFDAFRQAGAMRVNTANTMSADSDCFVVALAATSGNVATYRGPGGQSVHLAYTPAQRAAAAETRTKKK